MVITQKVGNIDSFDTSNLTIDLVPVEWFETGKRILHKKTTSGKDVVMKFLNERQALADGDVLWHDEASVVVVALQPCDAITIQPETMAEMASVCYEIGNKHLPLFYDNGELLIPFDAPLMKMLCAAGYKPKTKHCKLVNQLRTTVSPHASMETKQSLFSKILHLTSQS